MPERIPASRAIPSVPRSEKKGGAGDPHQQFFASIKENLERTMGRVPGSPSVDPLPDTATLPEVIAALNVLIRRLR